MNIFVEIFIRIFMKIHINILNIETNGIGIEWDVRRCDSFQQDKGKWSRLRPGEEIPK